MTSTTAALRVQELCDYITDFLTESNWDLKSCALVSSTFTSSAQHHLFHDIILNRGCLDIDDPSILERYDETGACRRFCAVLNRSPHLVPLVRRLRVSHEVDVLKPLCKLHFPNLHAVLLHRRRGGPISDESLILAAGLISGPSIRRVGLLSPIFRSILDLGRLFQACSTNLKSVLLHQVTISENDSDSPGDESTPPRIRIKALRWKAWYRQDAPWLLDPYSPFDFSGLTSLDYSPQLTPTMLKVLNRARFSLRRPTVDAQDALNPTYTEFPQPGLLAQFPALTHLAVTSIGSELADAAALLAGLPSTTRLVSLTLAIAKVRALQADALQALAAMCAGAPFRVAVHVRRVASGADGVDARALVRSAFAELDARGILEVVVR
ncbi:hypothetical protein DFH09DRAFT_1377840 [Mycena vulgaris]|nr:hypothetical protein DFH09DRAFT_1377840 [Mycena vulgaris]